ncbi:SDR family NAD(P)-dependent oxidoreductase [Vicingaceae bacterium]|nr:SDR family NAD(P)-dependent oxidoreductase [Vicingaceae bacterium]MDC1451074.1 SDR family NAD(P)-dependent oxidoreductase [Vicingaceae bacterium]
MSKVGVITGASSGIGQAITVRLSNGYSTLYICGRKLESLQKTMDLCSASKAEIIPIILDLNDKFSIKKAAVEIRGKEPKIHLLVNNAGQSQRSLVKDTSEEVEAMIMQINYFGQVQLTKLLLPALQNAQSSRILITSSIVGKFGYPLRSTYSASKHALHGFFESLRFEEKKNSIFVQFLVIGRVQTNVSVNALTAEGETYGKMDKGQAGGISAEACAIKIEAALQSNRKEVLIGGKELLMVKFKKYLPFLFYKIAEKESNHV